MTGISGATLAKLGQDRGVTAGILERICAALDCQLDEICEVTELMNVEEK